MQAHKITVTIDQRHEALLRLPDDFPTGEAEVIVLSVRRPQPSTPEERARSFDELVDSLPSAPSVPRSAFDRGELYR